MRCEHQSALVIPDDRTAAGRAIDPGPRGASAERGLWVPALRFGAARLRCGRDDTRWARRELFGSALALVLFIVAATSALAQRKPRLPAGLDPGGVAVAIAAPDGIDYTQPDIARRLARDGEGELIGWDFVDNDRFPFLPSDKGGGNGILASAARIVMLDAPTARITPFRTKEDVLALGRVMVFSGQGPVRVLLVLTATEAREPWAAFVEAAQHFRRVLVIVPVTRPTTVGKLTFPAGLGLDTVLTVAPAVVGKAEAIGTPYADLAAPSDDEKSAAARIAALAARFAADNPKLDGAALKARILALATPLPAPHTNATRHGWIAEPHKLP